MGPSGGFRCQVSGIGNRGSGLGIGAGKNETRLLAKPGVGWVVLKRVVSVVRDTSSPHLACLRGDAQPGGRNANPREEGSAGLHELAADAALAIHFVVHSHLSSFRWTGSCRDFSYVVVPLDAGRGKEVRTFFIGTRPGPFEGRFSPFYAARERLFPQGRERPAVYIPRKRKTRIVASKSRTIGSAIAICVPTSVEGVNAAEATKIQKKTSLRFRRSRSLVTSPNEAIR